MSIGAPSNLGTLLIQRLDAVLGTTLSQQANIASGAGPQAVPQPGSPESPNAAQNPTQRHPQESVNQAKQQGHQQAAVGKTVQDIQLANLLGRNATFQDITQSAPTTLGYAARIILALLHQFPRGSLTVRGQSPLLPTMRGTAGGNNAPAIAQALSQSIQTSGLFYESHLAQLALGKTTLHALQQEPQGSILPRPTPSGSTAPQAQHLSQTGVATGTPATTSGPGPEITQTAATTGQSHPAPVPGIDPQAQPLVRQQLEVLANQAFIWQGEAWPGASMQWEIQRRPQNDEGGREFQDAHWSTRLNLSLPALGSIQARLSLSGDQVVMRLTAPQSAERLGSAIESLRARLLAQGLQASQLSVLLGDSDPDAPIQGTQENDIPTS